MRGTQEAGNGVNAEEQSQQRKQRTADASCEEAAEAGGDCSQRRGAEGAEDTENCVDIGR